MKPELHRKTSADMFEEQRIELWDTINKARNQTPEEIDRVQNLFPGLEQPVIYAIMRQHVSHYQVVYSKNAMILLGKNGAGRQIVFQLKRLQEGRDALVLMAGVTAMGSIPYTKDGEAVHLWIVDTVNNPYVRHSTLDRGAHFFDSLK